MDKALYIIELNKALRVQAVAANELVYRDEALKQATDALAEATLHFDAANIKVAELHNHPVFGNKVNSEIANLNKPVAL